MCNLVRTRYTCGHQSPIHRPNYKPPNFKEQLPWNTGMFYQLNPNTEEPTGEGTSISRCANAMKTGRRCKGPLDKMETVTRILDEGKEMGACKDCALERLEKEEGWIVCEDDGEEAKNGK